MFVALHRSGGWRTLLHAQNEWYKDTGHPQGSQCHSIQGVGRVDLERHTHKWKAPGIGSTKEYIHRRIHTHAPCGYEYWPIPIHIPCHWSPIVKYKQKWRMCVARGIIPRRGNGKFLFPPLLKLCRDFGPTWEPACTLLKLTAIL